MNLSTRPTKRTDTRSWSFDGESVELDAIQPDHLRKMVESCILQHVDEEVLETTKTAEASERELLENWEEIIGDLGDDDDLAGDD